MLGWNQATQLLNVSKLQGALGNRGLGDAWAQVPKDVRDGTNLLLMPEAALTNFTTFIVYTVTSLVELTTPASHLRLDLESSVSNTSTLKTRRHPVRGSPARPRLVMHYQVYLQRICLDESIVRCEAK